MPQPPPDARSFTAHAVACEPVGDDGMLLRLRTQQRLPPLRASRFFMLRRTDGASPLIPRPFSIYRQEGDELWFLVKVMGRGSRALAETPVGGELRVIGPLGNGWPTIDGGGDSGGPQWVFLGGGIGCAPFYMAIQQALAGMDGKQPVRTAELIYLFGAARAGLLYDLEEVRKLGVRVEVATDDGSAGFHGNVLDLLRHLQEIGELSSRLRVLACGPDPMLHAVAELARERDFPCWLSLETLMGCGVGICNGCPVPTRGEGELGAWPNAKCCVEGPVFNASAIRM